MGRFLLERLATAGYDVVATSRDARLETEMASLRWLTLDLTSPGAAQTLPECDVVVSLLPVWMSAELSRDLAGTPNPPHRIIAFSSTSVLTKSDSPSARDRKLSARLREGELNLVRLSPNSKTTIFRPTMIYGDSGDGNVEKVAKQLRKFRVFPMVGNGVGLRQPIHADDLAIAVVQVLSSADTEGKTYELGGGEVLSFRMMVARIGHANGVKPIFLKLPLRLARVALTLASVHPRFRSIPRESLARIEKDMVFDNARATIDFGFAPRTFKPRAANAEE